jgi:hypothetical protein
MGEFGDLLGESSPSRFSSPIASSPLSFLSFLPLRASRNQIPKARTAIAPPAPTPPPMTTALETGLCPGCCTEAVAVELVPKAEIVALLVLVVGIIMSTLEGRSTEELIVDLADDIKL